MATESSAVVRIARIAQQRPLRLPSEARERTVIVRIPASRGRWLWWGVAAVVVALTAALLASNRREAPALAPIAEPLIEAPVVATPLPEPTPPARVPAVVTESDSESAVEPRARADRPARRRAQIIGFGTLQIGSKPPCKIFIDGRKTGLSTPQREIRLRPGRHRVRLENREVGIDERFQVRIRDGRTTKVIRDMTDRL